jgi:hypothetical protein
MNTTPACHFEYSSNRSLEQIEMGRMLTRLLSMALIAIRTGAIPPDPRLQLCGLERSRQADRWSQARRWS